MACAPPRAQGGEQGGDAGGDPLIPPPRIPGQCEGSGQRGETNLKALKNAMRKNGGKPLTLDFDYRDQNSLRPIGDYASNLSSLIGEIVKQLPLDYDFYEDIPPTAKVSIMPTIQGYFDLKPHFNNQTLITIGKNTSTIANYVKLGLQQSIKKQYRQHKNRVKTEWFSSKDSVEEAKRNPPPEKFWSKSQEEWERMVDWWSDPKRMDRSEKNSQNRAKNKVTTHQGSKSFAQGRNEYLVQNGRYEDLIESWKRFYSKNGIFSDAEAETFYNQMKALQNQVRTHSIPFMTNQEIIERVIQTKNREHIPGVGRRLPWTGSSSRMIPEAFGQDYVNRAHVTEMIRRSDEEKELLRNEALADKQQSLEASQRLAGLEAFIGQFLSHYNQQMQNQPGSSPFIFTPPVMFPVTFAPLPVPSSSAPVPIPSSSAPFPVPSSSAPFPVPVPVPGTSSSSAPFPDPLYYPIPLLHVVTSPSPTTLTITSIK